MAHFSPQFTRSIHTLFRVNLRLGKRRLLPSRLFPELLYHRISIGLTKRTESFPDRIRLTSKPYWHLRQL
jgi:hypothetical protein